jgi:hypothetical protein
MTGYKMTTPINSIKIPQQYVDLCNGWYDGVNYVLYAIASTGKLTLGSIRPRVYDSDRYMTDEEWYWSLFSDLSIELRQTIKNIDKRNKQNEVEDYEELKNFLDWAEEIADGLATEYGIDI